jgi:hypothetical protein
MWELHMDFGAGFIYSLIKDLWGWFINRSVYEEKTENVTSGWFDNSGMKSELKKQGYSLYWSRIDKIREREASGYEIHFEFNRKHKIKTKFICKSGDSPGVVLMKKKLGKL